MNFEPNEYVRQNLSALRSDIIHALFDSLGLKIDESEISVWTKETIRSMKVDLITKKLVDEHYKEKYQDKHCNF